MKCRMFSLSTGMFLILAGPSLFAQDKMREESLKYFDQAVKVFQHPRCLNCHPAGDRPSQGMDMHEHIMNIQRGPKDHGMVALNCAACHGDKNNASSLVPGAPKWALAPKEMAWQGKSKGDLCRSLKDAHNPGFFAGKMTKEQFIHHNAEDKLVAWGWNPGPGREPAPMTQKKFGEIIAKWVHSGAACPD